LVRLGMQHIPRLHHIPSHSHECFHFFSFLTRHSARDRLRPDSERSGAKDRH
jgi:hypothetical protein